MNSPDRERALLLLTALSGPRLTCAALTTLALLTLTRLRLLMLASLAALSTFVVGIIAMLLLADIG